MVLSDYLRLLDAAEKEALAGACNTTVAYLYQLAGRHRMPSFTLAKDIETHSKGKVTRYDWPSKEEAA